MNKTEIKKALYKQKPVAEFTHIRKGTAHYRTVVRDESQKIPCDQPIFFEIPIDDMGDADFTRDMDNAQHLNRWIMFDPIFKID